MDDERADALLEGGDDKPGGGGAPWYRSRRAFVLGAAGLTAVAVALGLGLTVASDGPAQPAPDRFEPLPVVVATWFPSATQRAYDRLAAGFTALDAVELGCTLCEDEQCDGTVGYGGSPDESGETTLDALIMDGETHRVGAVTYLRRIRHAIAAARLVMAHTQHTVLSGDGATNFSVQMGLPLQDLHTNESLWIQGNFTKNDCQPNYWQAPFNTSGCGPFTPVPTPSYTPAYTPVPVVHADGRAGHAVQRAPSAPRAPPQRSVRHGAGPREHDTVGMCALDLGGRMAAGGSSNGATHKIPGRVSDISLVGAGSYVDRDAGCAGATGDGDVTMRFLPAYQAVEFMRGGMHPQAACENAVRRIMAYFGADFHLGLVCMDRLGRIGAAGQGWTFTYAIASGANATARVVAVPPLPVNS